MWVAFEAIKRLAPLLHGGLCGSAARLAAHVAFLLEGGSIAAIAAVVARAAIPAFAVPATAEGRLAEAVEAVAPASALILAVGPELIVVISAGARDELLRSFMVPIAERS